MARTKEMGFQCVAGRGIDRTASAVDKELIGLPRSPIWRHSAVTNGPTEGLNNLIKRIKRVAFGFWNFANYRIEHPYTLANRTGTPRNHQSRLISKRPRLRSVAELDCEEIIALSEDPNVTFDDVRGRPPTPEQLERAAEMYGGLFAGHPSKPRLSLY